MKGLEKNLETFFNRFGVRELAEMLVEEFRELDVRVTMLEEEAEQRHREGREHGD